MSESQFQCGTCLAHLSPNHFYPDPVRRGGLSWSCKACYSAISKERWRRPRSEEEKARHRAAVKRSIERNPEEQGARKKLAAAKKKGLVTPWPVCAVPECASGNPHGHHPDYSNPLSVVWLCHAHHKQVHKETNDARR